MFNSQYKQHYNDLGCSLPLIWVRTLSIVFRDEEKKGLRADYPRPGNSNITFKVFS